MRAHPQRSTSPPAVSPRGSSRGGPCGACLIDAPHLPRGRQRRQRRSPQRRRPPHRPKARGPGSLQNRVWTAASGATGSTRAASAAYAPNASDRNVTVERHARDRRAFGKLLLDCLIHSWDDSRDNSAIEGCSGGCRKANGRAAIPTGDEPGGMLMPTKLAEASLLSLPSPRWAWCSRRHSGCAIPRGCPRWSGDSEDDEVRSSLRGDRWESPPRRRRGSVEPLPGVRSARRRSTEVKCYMPTR
jgi:hypothetical protein